MRLYCREVLAIAGSAPRMIAVPMADAGSAAGARHHAGAAAARRPVQCRRVVRAMQAPSRRARDRPGLRAVVWPAARIDRTLRRPARATRSTRSSRRHGARQVVIVAHSMGGLVARAYLRRLRRRARSGASITHRHAAPGQRARVAVARRIASSQLRPGSAWLAELAQPRTRAAPRRSCRCGRGTTRWSRRRRRRVLDGAENIALTGIGHNALLATPTRRARRRIEVAARRYGRVPSRVERRRRLIGSPHREAAARRNPSTSECPA